MGWDISALLFRYEDLTESDPCPPYRAIGDGTYLLLQPYHSVPNVGFCRKVMATFELLVDKLGFRDTKFTFGCAADHRECQGMVQIGTETPILDPPWDLNI